MQAPKFTHKAQQTIQFAVKTSQNQNNPAVDDLHILSSLLEIDGVSREIIGQITNLDEIKTKVKNNLEKLPTTQNPPENPHITSNVQKIINTANKQAKSRGDDYLSQELLLLALTLTECQSNDI